MQRRICWTRARTSTSSVAARVSPSIRRAHTKQGGEESGSLDEVGARRIARRARVIFQICVATLALQGRCKEICPRRFEHIRDKVRDKAFRKNCQGSSPRALGKIGGSPGAVGRVLGEFHYCRTVPRMNKSQHDGTPACCILLYLWRLLRQFWTSPRTLPTALGGPPISRSGELPRQPYFGTPCRKHTVAAVSNRRASLTSAVSGAPTSQQVRGARDFPVALRISRTSGEREAHCEADGGGRLSAMRCLTRGSRIASFAPHRRLGRSWPGFASGGRAAASDLIHSRAAGRRRPSAGVRGWSRLRCVH